MPLSPEQEWTLVACGLVAHADGILEVGEWDQVIWMLDERIDADESEAWLAILADRAALDERLGGLPLPPPFFSEAILDKAWRMALADGVGSDAEGAVHDSIASKLGIDGPTVAGWRTTWTRKAAERAELVAGFAAYLACADDTVSVDERNSFEDLLEKLPLSDTARAQARESLDTPPDQSAIMVGFAALPPEERSIAMLGLVPIVLADRRSEQAREAFLELADRIAVSRADAERMLER